ncbi:MAG: hypothetical protein PVI38_17390 [Desulfobacterales bacterium]|jgi:hypothetical protein
MQKVISILLVLLVSSSAFGFCIQGNLPTMYPSHSCSKPDLPSCIYSKDCGEYEIALVKIQLGNYRICIEQYLGAVEDHIECARERASEARDEYNNLINSFQ